MAYHYHMILAAMGIMTAALAFNIVDDAELSPMQRVNTQEIVEIEAIEEFEVIEEVEEVKEPVFNLSEYERWVVECIVMGEAKGESYNGKALVAQCILNSCLFDGIQPSEVRTKYKYAGWDEEPSDEVKEVVSAVFDDGYQVTDEPILFFYAPNVCNSTWHETQRHIITEGGHKFFALWED